MNTSIRTHRRHTVSRRSALWLCLGASCLAAGCQGDPADPDNGSAPTGTTSAPLTTWVTDALELPMSPTQFGDDLNGDGSLHNQFGVIEGTLSNDADDGSGVVPSMLKDCAVLPAVQVVMDGGGAVTAPGMIRWQAGDTDALASLGGTWHGRNFVSDRAVAQRSPVTGVVHLPVFSHSDPIAIAVEGLEIELTRRGTGYDAQVHGAVPPSVDIRPAVWGAFVQMIANEPGGHVNLVKQIDTDHDGQVSLEEFEASALVQTLLTRDVRLFDGNGAWLPDPQNSSPDSLSIGFGFHLVQTPDSASGAAAGCTHTAAPPPG